MPTLEEKTSDPHPAEEPGESHEGHAGRAAPPLLCEVSWEVCQQLGGIYTVIRSKAPAMIKTWGRSYCVVGPYNPRTSPAEFEESPPSGPFGQVVKAMTAAGMKVHHGYWLISGRPRAVLLDTDSVSHRLGEIKYLFWEHHDISTPAGDHLIDHVVAFGAMVREFFRILCEQQSFRRGIIGHFHEWMAGTAIPEIRRDKLPVSTVFTTHATLLGRYLAMHDDWFYDHLPFVNWSADARRFNIEAQVRLERAAAHGSHVFTTVSDITALECEHLLGRKPDALVPNGLNIERFVALHEFQNLHRMYKEKIHQFVMGHFFPSYTFDLDRTIYFFTSGRYEFRNKGFDVAIEALARLNWRLKKAGTNRTIVFFLITRAAYRSVNAEALQSRAEMEEIRKDCEAIKNQIGERLFVATAMGKSPGLDELVDDYWRLRLRRKMYAWKTSRLPSVVTHDLDDEGADAVLARIRQCDLLNRAEDPVKIVYHPEFIAASSPLFGMDYDQFVRGCHLGVFPSYYEPWGYAPLECAALGVPAVTTDLSGFGTYLLKNMPDHLQRGLVVLHRRFGSFNAAADELANAMFTFAQMGRRERIALRNQVESSSEQFDWENLGRYYAEAHRMALERTGA